MTAQTPVTPSAKTAGDAGSGTASRRSGPVGRALSLRSYLAEPMDFTCAEENVRTALETRNDRFLTSMRRLVYGQPDSPYRHMLHVADCAYGDIESAVRERGLEPTLRMLRDAGVYVTADEWKGRAPVTRDGLELEVSSSNFDNPMLGEAVAEGGSSGSSGGPVRTTSFGKVAMSEAAEDFVLLLEEYGVLDAPTAAWMPAPPGSGRGVMLLWAKLGNPPERWFSQTKPAESRAQRIVTPVLGIMSGLLLGVRIPQAGPPSSPMRTKWPTGSEATRGPASSRDSRARSFERCTSRSSAEST